MCVFPVQKAGNIEPVTNTVCRKQQSSGNRHFESVYEISVASFPVDYKNHSQGPSFDAVLLPFRSWGNERFQMEKAFKGTCFLFHRLPPDIAVNQRPCYIIIRVPITENEKLGVSSPTIIISFAVFQMCHH